MTAIDNADQPVAIARPPLGLPNGSVRALLTLLIVAMVVTEVARGRHVELLWTETLMIALAHYFTSRRFIRLPPPVLERLEAEGHLPRESQPLFLPRHSIRGLIVLAFVGVAVYLYRQNRLLEPESLSILGTVAAYLLGVLARSIWGWLMRHRAKGASPWWEDFKAVLVLIVLSINAAAYLFDRVDLLPHQSRTVAVALVLFYFGSR